MAIRYYYNPMTALGQMAQQNPFYNPFSPYPNIGGGIANMLQQWYALQQYQQQQQQKQEQWQKEYELARKRVELTERGLGLEEARLYKPPDWLVKAKVLSEATGKPLSETIPAILGYTSPEQELETFEKKEEIRAKIGAKYRQPSVFKEKINEIKQAYKQGLIDNNEYKEAYKTILGIQKAGGLTQYQTMNARENIARNVRTIYNNYIKQRFGTQPQEDVERVLAKPKPEDVLALLPQGIDPRFPQEFNIAIANIKAGIATPEERELVKNFLDLAEAYKSNVLRYKESGVRINKKELMNIAKELVKNAKYLRWFKIWVDNPDLWFSEKVLGYKLED